MTDEAKALVERLREQYGNLRSGISQHPLEAADRIEALEARVAGLTHERDFHRETADLHADRIEALEAENERLRDVLEEIAGAHLERVGHCQTDIDEVPDLTAREAMSAARAALKEIDNGDR